METQTRYEDVLALLPACKPALYSKGQMIYSKNGASTSIYLVCSGNVGISEIADNGAEVLLDILGPDELFGESAFLNAPHHSQHAKAIETAQVMTWPIADIGELITKRPPLGVALMQMLAHRNADYARRIESLAIDSIERRLARSLIRFSERLGTRDEGGCVKMLPLTHEMLSQYVGTSREIITQYMNRFRKRGYVSYSRQSIILYRDTLQTVLQGNGPSSKGHSSYSSG